MQMKKGISLIVLVLTIIVMIILASAVIISLNNANIISRAQEAVNDTNIQTEKEIISQAYLMSMVGRTSVSDTVLENAINSGYTDPIVSVEDGLITFLASGRKYRIDENKNVVAVNTIDWATIFATAQAPEEQTTQNVIGLAEDGTAVNMDYWNYVSEGTSYTLSDHGLGCFGNIGSFEGNRNGYKGTIVNGQIQGKVPMYIKDGSGEFLPVTAMPFTFAEMTTLTTVPDIPSTVTEIPGLFYGCTGLTSMPEIPATITNIENTFQNCSNLTGNLVINATIAAPEIVQSTYSSYFDTSNINNCLKGASTESGTSLVLSGSCAALEAIYLTKTEGANITLAD